MKTDLTYLNSISNGNNGVVIEMINIFIIQVDEFIENMEASLSKKDWNYLSKIAHKAKSSVSIMGMNDLSNELKTLEILSNEKKDIDKYPEFVSKFKDDCKEAVIELKRYISNL